jgi:cytochrome c-type biogenesis protein
VTSVVAEPGWGIAFAAGVVSFLSPCVAPLAPGFLAYVAGTSLDSSAAGRARVTMRALSTSLLFMLGFTLVFVLLGTSVSLLGGFFEEHRSTMYQVAGAAMIFFGLLVMGLPRIAWLQREWSASVSPDVLGPAAPVLLGMAFAFAWTPCVGPILGSILLYAGATETAGRGGLLLFVYSLGFGIPFILAGLGFASALRAFSWMRRHSVIVNAVAGALLIGVGVLLLLGRWGYLNVWFQRAYYNLT